MTNITRYFKLNRRGESQAHVVYAVTFTIIAVVALVGLIMVNTEADTEQSGQTTTISNTAPSAGTPTVWLMASGSSNPDSIAPSEGTRVNAFISGTATDSNGCADIDGTGQYAVKFWRTDTHTDGAHCTDNSDNSSCVVATATPVLGSCVGTNTDVTYVVTFPLGYIATPTEDTLGVPYSTTNWTGRVAVTDDGELTATAVDTVELSLLRALDVTSDTNFGAVAVGGDTHASTSTIVVKNTGNMTIDYTVGFNQDMQCTSGSFPGRNVYTGRNSSGAVAGMVSENADHGADDATYKYNASVSPATAMATSSTSNLYAYVAVPAGSGVGGTCSNTAAYTAIADGSTGK